MVLITFSRADRLFTDLNTVQFSYGLITPAGNLLRAMLLTLNQSQLLCRNQEYVSYPGDITVYGGPILYLVLQTIAFYSFLVVYDSGWKPRLGLVRRRRNFHKDAEKTADSLEGDVLAEARRVETSDDGLQVLHLTKRFGKNTAVDNITFGVKHDEILALLGPNGAGKSSTIDAVRGRTRPSMQESDVRIEGLSVLQARTAASRFLGVCPQFDTLDKMTVTEHLSFYGRVRGVPDVDSNVVAVIQAVGLGPFRQRMAAKLSGGNQRKLSLATAIIGNPSVLLLDEPSSGMDAVAKRIMWKVISAISAGRSMVITTHSMEEASALANRAAIMAKRLLAIGDVKKLSDTYGEGLFHVHLFHREGAAMVDEDIAAIHEWVGENFPGARWTGKTLHGQFRFAVTGAGVAEKNKIQIESAEGAPSGHDSGAGHLTSMLQLLEANKEKLGIEYYSVNETTLEDVFLTIIGRERGIEES